LAKSPVSPLGKEKDLREWENIKGRENSESDSLEAEEWAGL